MSEYIERKRLAKLGITCDINNLPAWKCDAFLVIDSKLDELIEKKQKEASRRSKKGRG